MATPNATQDPVAVQCARCGEKYNQPEYEHLDYLDRQQAGHYEVELRRCSCAATLALVLLPSSDEVARLQRKVANLQARIESLLHDLDTAHRSREAFEKRLGDMLTQAKNERRKAANQEPPPNPPGTVTVIRDLDPSDPNVRLCRRRGG